MKKYSYRFDSLLRIRGLQEEMAIREFRDAMRKYTEALELLDGLRAEKTGLLEELLQQRTDNSPINMQMLFLDYLKVLERRIIDGREKAHRLGGEAERRREKMIEAVKERKIFDRLHVKDFDAYLEELRRWEQSIIDDLATLRHQHENALTGL